MNKEFIKLTLLGFVIVFIVGLFLKNFIDAIKFAVTYLLLFYIPILIWIIKIKKLKTFGKIIITNLIAISLIPFLYAVIGFFTPLNTFLFILPSILVALAGILVNKTVFNKSYKQK